MFFSLLLLLLLFFAGTASGVGSSAGHAAAGPAWAKGSAQSLSGLGSEVDASVWPASKRWSGSIVHRSASLGWSGATMWLFTVSAGTFTRNNMFKANAGEIMPRMDSLGTPT